MSTDDLAQRLEATFGPQVIDSQQANIRNIVASLVEFSQRLATLNQLIHDLASGDKEAIAALINESAAMAYVYPRFLQAQEEAWAIVKQEEWLSNEDRIEYIRDATEGWWPPDTHDVSGPALLQLRVLVEDFSQSLSDFGLSARTLQNVNLFRDSLQELSAQAKVVAGFLENEQM